MPTVHKWLILTHRYLGILLGGLFIVWFASGIAMMYARGMPQLTPEVRLARLSEIDLSQVRLSPQEASEALGLPEPGRATLLTVGDRPAYRLDGSATVFADDGTRLGEIDREGAVEIARLFMDVGRDEVSYSTFVTQSDQWTLSVRSRLPLHKIIIGDESRTELYVSPTTGAVEMLTTRGSRALAWFAAIPHWFYFTPLRVHQELWTQTILWTAGMGCILALLGLVLGVWQFRFRPRSGRTDIASRIPYTGWMRWHYITGVIFGLFTLTWVFSGLLSMEPLGWAAGSGLTTGPIQRALQGGSLDLDRFPPIDAASWTHLTGTRALKEVDYTFVQGHPFFALSAVDRGDPTRSDRVLVDATALEIRGAPFSTDSLMSLVEQSYPDVVIVESELLSEYDSYYYDRDMRAPLPVLRVQFDDPDETWFYIDPATSRLSGSVHRLDRIERWIYNGFHSLDFGFWYYNRPLWESGVIVLSLGGLSTSAIGLYLGLGRLLKGMRRP